MSVDTTRFCGSCGAARESTALRFCRQCGAAFASTGVVPAVAPAPSDARRRPRWVVGLLGLFGSATYAFFWSWMSWRELKRIRGDASMSPFWHATAMFVVPIYGLFRFHAHFRTIDELLEAAHVPVRAGATLLTIVFVLLLTLLYGSLTIGFAAAAQTGSTPSLAPLSLILIASGYAYVVGTGQAALNAYYRSLAGVDVPERGRAFEYIFLVLFAAAFAAQLFVSAPGRTI
jgi:hypothetical protein